MTETKKLKKWQKVLIIFLVVIGLLFGALKIFRKPIIRLALNQDEQFVFDTYNKTQRALKDIDTDLVIKEVYTGNRDNSILLTSVVFTSSHGKVIVDTYYNTETKYVNTLINYFTFEELEKKPGAMPFKDDFVDNKKDLFHYNQIDESSDVWCAVNSSDEYERYYTFLDKNQKDYNINIKKINLLLLL